MNAVERFQRQRLAETAHHESGHAIAALALEIPVEFASTWPDHAAGSLGRVQFGRRSVGGLAGLEALVVALAAGAEAQRIFAPRSDVRTGATTDRLDIDHLGFVAAAGPGKALATPAEVRPFARRAAYAARAVIREQWWRVHRVADMLIRQRTASGFAIAECMAEADDEWRQLAGYYPGSSQVEVMRTMAREARPRPVLDRRQIERATLRAAAAGRLDVKAAVTTDLVGRGFARDDISKLWRRIAA